MTPRTSILTKPSRLKICNLFRAGKSPRQIARRFAIGHRLVEQVIREEEQ